MLIKQDVGWYGRANFAGKSFDSVHLIPFKGCFKDFSVIEYTYVACFKIAMWLVFALCGLIVFMVYSAKTYSQAFQTSKMGFFVKIVTSNDITSLLRRWKGFWNASAEFKVNCLTRFCYIYLQYILCLKSHVYFHSKP